MRNAGRVVSKTMILSHVWEYNFDPQTNIVDVLVSRLRDKIDRALRARSCCTRSAAWAMSSELTPRPRSAVRAAARAVVRDAVRRRRHRHRLSHLLPDGDRRSRSAISRSSQPKLGEYAAVYTRGGIRALADDRPRRAADGARAAVRARRRSRRRGARAQHAARAGIRRRSRRRRCGSPTARSCRWGRAPRRGWICSRDSAPRSDSSRCRSSSSRSPADGSRRSRRCARSDG